MLLKKQIEAMNIAFDFRKGYTIARVPHEYANADTFALDLVYWLRPYVARKLDIADSDVVLIAISKNNKVVLLCENGWYRECLGKHFKHPSIGSAQLYDDVKPELIIEKIDALFPKQG